MRGASEEMSCREFVEVVTEYLEGALDERRRAALHAHIDACGGCTEYLRQMRLTIHALGELPLEDDLGAARGEAIDAFRRLRAGAAGAHD